MMKQVLITLLLLPLFSLAQLNMNQIGYLNLATMHSSELSDIWGWVDGSGNEYAIVGINNGTSVVDLSDPTNPEEVFYEPGMNSIWRDIKTWNNYAYVTTEAENGLLIIDLSTLPSDPNLSTSYYTGPVGSEWQSAHNLFIDENGICYIFGANRDNKGVIMLDLSIDPLNPVEVGVIDNWYAHDGMARGDTLYLGHINDGHMSIWDVSNKSNPILLGQQFTPGNFAHNLWLSDDGNYIYTTDEISDGYLGEFDVSDPTDIVELDRTQSSPGMNVIPHNSHYLDDYIITSYYADGVVVHDVSNKGNMVEVANYDTSPTYEGDGYNGCWGVYPWLPSGNIIASDIENGLHVLGVSYNRGCYLSGNVTNLNSGAPINNVNITIVNANITDQSNIVGDYSSGVATPGTYDIIYSNPAYVSDTLFGVNMVSGQTTIEDVQLVPLEFNLMTVTVTDAIDGVNPIPNANVLIENDQFSYTGVTDVNGDFVIPTFYAGVYEVHMGIWGYSNVCELLHTFGPNDETYSAELETGYMDNFTFHLNWLVDGLASVGVWERDVPLGTELGGGMQSNPDEDSQDCGNKAYVTGNGFGQAGDDDVDGEETILYSPIMDLTSYSAPKILFDYWWVNESGQVTPNDTLKIIISDGITEIVASNILAPSSMDSWRSISFNVLDYVTLTNANRLIVKTADWEADGGNIVEAGIDNFRVVETVEIEESIGATNITVFPNPSSGDFTIKNESEETAIISVYDITGKQVLSSCTFKDSYLLRIEHSGIYTAIIESRGVSEIVKIIKL